LKPIILAATACLLVDAQMPGYGWRLASLRQLNSEGTRLPAIMITGQGDVPIAVEAMKAGAADFIEKPIRPRRTVRQHRARPWKHARDLTKFSVISGDAGSDAPRRSDRAPAARSWSWVLAGHPSKNIAADLGISQRTVENHRAVVMKKTGSHSAFGADPLGARRRPKHHIAISRLTDSAGRLGREDRTVS